MIRNLEHISIRPAVPGDLHGIMKVEQESWGEHVGEEGMATPDIMLGRIELVNDPRYPPGFWVAEVQTPSKQALIVGYAVVQITDLRSKECTSWNVATDQGTLRGTYRPEAGSPNIFGVSLAVGRKAPKVTTPLLLLYTFLTWMRSGARLYFFCSRMPGFARTHKRSGCTPEEYIKLRRRSGTYRDAMLQMYAELTGGRPERVLCDGYRIDADSGGHAVLFVAEDPMRAIMGAVRQIYEAGWSEGRMAFRGVS